MAEKSQQDAKYSFAIGFAVGKDKVPLVGTYTSEKGFELELAKPAELDTLRNILENYIDRTVLTGLPDFVQKALDVTATIRHLQYKGVRVASATAPGAEITIDAKVAEPMKSALAGAKVSKLEAKEGQPEGWELKNGDDVYVDFAVRKEKKENADIYYVEQKAFTFVLTAEYKTPLPLVKGVIDFSFIAFGITKDPGWDQAKLDKETRILTEKTLPPSLAKKAPALPAAGPN